MRRLRPRFASTVAALAGVAVLLSLCAWQLDRHIEKNAGVEPARAALGQPPLDGAALSQSPLPLYRHLQLSGRFVDSVLLEGGRQVGTSPAYGVIQVFETSAGQRIVVDRGAILSLDRAGALSRLPSPPTVQGQLRPVPRSMPSAPVNPGEEPQFWRARSLGAMHASLEDVEPGVYLKAGSPLAEGESPEPSPDLADGYQPVTVRYESLHYAYQWAAIAALLIGLWVWGSLEKPEPES